MTLASIPHAKRCELSKSQIQNKANFHRNIILEFSQLVRSISVKTT